MRSSIAVEVEDKDTHTLIDQAQHPNVTLSGEAAVRDGSGLFLYTNMDPGTYTCQAAADGYQNASQAVTVEAGEITSVTFSMSKGTTPNGCPRGQIGNATPNTPLSNYFGDILLLASAAALLLLTRSALQADRKTRNEISDSTGCSE